MTDRAATSPSSRPVAKPRRKRLQPGPVFVTGAVTFALVLGLLGWQVAVGKDPSLGHGKQKAKVVHRTIHRTVITKVHDAPETIYVPAEPSYSDGGYSGGGGYSSGGYSGGGYSGGSSGSSSSGSSSYSAPTYSAPTYSAPPVSSGAS